VTGPELVRQRCAQGLSSGQVEFAAQFQAPAAVELRVHVELPEAILEITDEHRLPGADPRYGPVVVGPVVLDLARCSRSAGFDARGAPQVCHRGRRDHRVN
jgi:hypothetical protein